MFDTLTEKLTTVFARLGNKGRLTEDDVGQALREVRLALLEADVNFKIAREFVARVKEKAIGGGVLHGISPGQQVIKITNEEMTALLGGGVQKLAAGPQPPSVILMIGLNGSGKTTTSAKLARSLKQSGQQPLLVAADLARPAAIEQLKTLGGQIEVPVFEAGSKGSPVDVAGGGVKEASRLGSAWVIIDTAGRFQVDDELMDELEEIFQHIVYFIFISIF